jgi:hypothetical protein
VKSAVIVFRLAPQAREQTVKPSFKARTFLKKQKTVAQR